ncbi:MAG: aminoacyl-tRNA hydrolase [Pseudomonadota bacterium]
MRLFVGLGNPGAKYEKHRHNIGFMAVDRIAEAHGFDAPKAKFQGHVAEGFLEGLAGRERVLLLKPQTYMNESGRSIGEAARFYKIPTEKIVVFYDELDLAPGKVKAKRGGGAAGHNGIRSTDPVIGKDYLRVRMGIGHPGSKERVTGHVLGDFAKADYEWLEPLLDATARACPMLLADDDGARFMTELARLTAPPKAETPKPRPAGTQPSEGVSPQADTPSEGPMAEALRKLKRDGG